MQHTVFSLDLEGMRWRGESVVSKGHFFQILSPLRQRLGGCALRQTRERHTPVSNPPFFKLLRVQYKVVERVSVHIKRARVKHRPIVQNKLSPV